MIMTITKRICDICKKEVDDLPGSLDLHYSDCDYTGCGFPVKIGREDICIDCCRKLDKIVTEALKDLENAFTKALKEAENA